MDNRKQTKIGNMTSRLSNVGQRQLLWNKGSIVEMVGSGAKQGQSAIYETIRRKMMLWTKIAEGIEFLGWMISQKFFRNSRQGPAEVRKKPNGVAWRFVTPTSLMLSKPKK